MRSRRPGFTLIELLTVIAIIGILAGVLFPAISGIRKRAVKATSQTAFSQLANGILKYKQTYGYYPHIGTGNYNTASDTLHQINGDVTLCTKMVKAMSGKNPNGSALSAADRRDFNRNAEEFFAFAREDFFDYTAASAGNPVLIDRFGNHNIQMIFDTSGDGSIRSVTVPGLSELPEELVPISTTGGLPARVIIFTSENYVGSTEGLGRSDCADVVAVQ
ncbi:MAG: type II secretion system protein [Opitutales bacterium]